MAFVKQQWKLLTLAAIAVASIGVGVWQAMAADQVKQAMQPAISLGRSLKGLTSSPVPQENWIEQRLKENTQAKEDLERLIRKVEVRQKYNLFYGPQHERKPLVEGVLPEDQSTTRRNEFKKAYREAVKEFVPRLNGGAAPTDSELSQAEQAFFDEQAARQNEATDPWILSKGTFDVVAGVSTEFDRGVELFKNPRVKYSLEVARQIRMYVDDNAFAVTGLAQKDEAPSVVEIWQAQMSLWIQQDICRALAAVNAAAAEALAAEGRADDDWVAHMPIKRLMTAGVADVLGGPPWENSHDKNTVLQFMFIEKSYTRRENNAQRFVVPILLEMIVATKDTPRIVDGFATASLMTPVQISYKSVPGSWDQIGYVYGPDPVVRIYICVEAYYLHSVFGAFMPKDIKQDLRRPIKLRFKEGQVGRQSPG